MDANKSDAGEGPVEADEVERLRQALEEQRQQNLRLLADFDNLRLRVSRENESSRGEARRAALLPILGVLDTLERALAVGSTDPDFYEGIAATQRLFLNALREAGAVPVETVGQPFDPKLHEAIATVPSDDVEPGTVAREVRRGWRLEDGLLRPAQVVVAKDQEPARPWR
jgi:molecular chaperone GrpE